MMAKITILYEMEIRKTLKKLTAFVFNLLKGVRANWHLNNKKKNYFNKSRLKIYVINSCVKIIISK